MSGGGRVLVAGVGNIFLGDDGFGVEVVRRLGGESFPDNVRVVDFGIRGIHLAYELLDGYETAILVDAAPRGGTPGTVYVIEHDRDGKMGKREDGESASAMSTPLLDAHGMEPVAVLGLVETLGGRVGKVLVVGCEPATVEEGIGLSPPVAGAVEEAIRVVRELVAEIGVASAVGLAGGRVRAANEEARR